MFFFSKRVIAVEMLYGTEFAIRGRNGDFFLVDAKTNFFND